MWIMPGSPPWIAGVRRKIEHIPDVRRPHVRMALEALNHELMVLRLIFFGVVVAAGMRAVQVRHALRAVFAVSEAALREAEMEEPIHRSLRNRPGTYQPR